jgi:hypothetical protein
MGDGDYRLDMSAENLEMMIGGYSLSPEEKKLLPARERRASDLERQAEKQRELQRRKKRESQHRSGVGGKGGEAQAMSAPLSVASDRSASTTSNRSGRAGSAASAASNRNGRVNSEILNWTDDEEETEQMAQAEEGVPINRSRSASAAKRMSIRAAREDMRKAQSDVAVLTSRLDDVEKRMEKQQEQIEQQQRLIIHQQQQLRSQAVAIVELGGSSKLITQPLAEGGGASLLNAKGGVSRRTGKSTGCVIM